MHLLLELRKENDKAFHLKNIPFYRYTQYESKLGFRNVFFSFFKKNSFYKQKGFTEIRNTMSKVKPRKYTLNDKPNIHLEEIEKLCRKENINVYFFTAPMLETEINTEVIDKHLDNYHDFSQIFSDLNLFKDSTHLNWRGAEKFTDIFINHYFE